MQNFIHKVLLLGGIFAAGTFGEEVPGTRLDSSVVVSVEGQFVNRDFSPVRFDLVWKHLPASADTFDIVLSDGESFRYVSSGSFRYMEYRNEKVRRQMAAHHLKEFIGESPVTWNHLEALFRGELPAETQTETDTVHIHGIRDYDGIALPAIVDYSGKGGRGSLWIRTVQKIRVAAPPAREETSIFDNGTRSESKIPLILQMD